MIKRTIILLVSCALISFVIPAWAQDAAFPRCELGAKKRTSFLDHYAKGHLAIADADFEGARDHFIDALELCMDDELVWFLARVHERLGDSAIAERLDETWRAQRQLHGLSLDPPEKPSWATGESTTRQAIATRTLELDEHASSHLATGTYPIPLPSAYKQDELVKRIQIGAFPSADTMARLSVTVAPDAGATLWLPDGTFLGKAPLEEVIIPADTDIVLVLKINDEQILARTIRAEPRTHHKLFITVPK